MTINQAISVLKEFIQDGPLFSPDDRRDAVKIAYYALILIQTYRADPYHRFIPPFPGETRPHKPLDSLTPPRTRKKTTHELATLCNRKLDALL